MTVNDPFDTAPYEEGHQKKTVEEVSVDVKPNLLPLDFGEVVITHKGGAGFADPWIVIHAKDVQDARSHYEGDNAVALADLAERAAKFSGFFQAKVGSSAVAGRPQRQAAPPEAQEAPGGEVRSCPHGKMRFRSGVSKAGKPYKGFFCSSDDRNEECKPQFLR